MYHVQLFYKTGVVVRGDELHKIIETIGDANLGMLPRRWFIAGQGDNTQVLFKDRNKALKLIDDTIDLDYIVSETINSVHVEGHSTP